MILERLRGAEEGSATLECAVVFPGALALVALGIQGGLYWHGGEVAQAAAQQGLAVARVSGLGAGEARASQAAAQLGGLSQTTTTGASGAEVSVRVSGIAPGILPGLALRVGRGAAGPPESYGRP